MVRRVPDSSAIPPEARAAATRMRAYIDEAVAEREARSPEDLLATLVAAKRDGQIPAQERTGICVLLFLAGISTAVGLVSTSLYLLAAHPDQRAALLASPELAPAAVDELLRYVSPVQALSRVTTAPAEVNGEQLPEGARVLLLYGAAKRDPRRFPDPDRLDVRRPAGRNLGFGEGIHVCLGAPARAIAGAGGPRAAAPPHPQLRAQRGDSVDVDARRSRARQPTGGNSAQSPQSA